MGALLLLALGFTGLLPVISTAASAAAAPAAASAPWSDNLLVNGDAEALRCTQDWTAQTPVPGWRVLRGAASVLCYEAFARVGEPFKRPRSAQGGRALFGAPGADTAIAQRVDVAAAAAAIDAGQVRYEIAAWLGGWRGRTEQALISLEFLDSADHPLAPARWLGDAAVRRTATGLTAHRAVAALPPGVRSILVTLHFPSGLTSYHNAYADELVLRLQGATMSAAATGPATASRLPALDHVAVVMMENTNYADVMHGAGPSVDARMPYLAALARQGVVLTQMWGNFHPSDENYVAMVAGDAFARGPVYFPEYSVTADHLGDRIDAAHRRWRAYAQNMRKPCNLQADAGPEGHYAPDDQPFALLRNVVDDPARCAAALRDLDDLRADAQAGTLADFSWIAADGYWDGEGAWEQHADVGESLEAQDAFLQRALTPLLESASWQHSRSLLVITWDESLGWGWPDNRIPTVLVGSPGLLRDGAVIDTHFDGYSVLRSTELALRVPGLGRFDEAAPDLASAFAGSAVVPSDQASAGLPALWPDDAAATRGSLSDTYGQVTVPASVRQGDPLGVVASGAQGGRVALASPGAQPGEGVALAQGRAELATGSLAPGRHVLWLKRDGESVFRAPRFVNILSAHASSRRIGVRLPGRDTELAAHAPVQIREGGNTLVAYCRPTDVPADQAWVAVRAVGSPVESVHFPTTAGPGDVIRASAPANAAGEACGEAMVYTARLPPAPQYRIELLVRRGVAPPIPVGESVAFGVQAALP